MLNCKNNYFQLINRSYFKYHHNNIIIILLLLFCFSVGRILALKLVNESEMHSAQLAIAS
jgi:hypothetical protein